MHSSTIVLYAMMNRWSSVSVLSFAFEHAIPMFTAPFCATGARHLNVCCVSTFWPFLCGMVTEFCPLMFVHEPVFPAFVTCAPLSAPTMTSSESGVLYSMVYSLFGVYPLPPALSSSGKTMQHLFGSFLQLFVVSDVAVPVFAAHSSVLF